MFFEATLYLDATTPFGETLAVVDLQGEEALSELFTYTVVMQTSEAAVDFASVVGQPMTVRISMESGGTRYVNGIIGRWIQEESGLRGTVYYAELHPWLWMLTHTEDCCIFQNKTVPEIIEAVFTELGFTDYANELTGQYDPREYCVQYNETAFAFVSRLMEDEGIFYFFRHEDGKHTLVLADDASAFAALPNAPEATLLVSPDDDPTDASIRKVRIEEQVVSGSCALDDFNFETPETDLMVSADGTQAGQRVYHYPGGFTETSKGEARAGLRMDAREAPRRRLTGDGYGRDFTAGYTFTLKGHPRADANAEYVLRRVRLRATQDAYTNTFEAAPKTVDFRPPLRTRRPRIYGTQTAIVVGKSGEEIWTDQYGRVKVQFHWDQKGKKDENSSCWIRVAHGWAGKSWGMFFLPRIGQEVVVTFLEGDPDRPLVTGSVYNATQTVPYALPGEQTKSTIKSNSSKGGGGFNEIRFEDKKDSEEIYVHAQKDRNTVVENDDTIHVKKHRQTFVQEGAPAKDADAIELLRVEGNRKVTVARADSLETHTNEGEFKQLVTKNFTLKVDGDTLLIEAANDLIIKGKTVHIESTGGDTTIKSSMNMKLDAGQNLDAKAGQNLKTEAGMNLNEKAGMNFKAEAGMNLELKGGMALKAEGGMSLESKGGMTLKNEGGMSLESKGGMMNKAEAGLMMQIQGTFVKIN